MRVGYDAGGGTPFDATGARSTGASPGDAASASTGFFALLALLQGAAATAEVGTGASEELLGEQSPGEDGDVGGAGEAAEGGAAGDVIVSLSAAVAGVATDVAAAAAPPGAEGVSTTPAGTGQQAAAIVAGSAGSAHARAQVSTDGAAVVARKAAEGELAAATSEVTASAGAGEGRAGAAATGSKEQVATSPAQSAPERGRESAQAVAVQAASDATGGARGVPVGDASRASAQPRVEQPVANGADRGTASGAAPVAGSGAGVHDDTTESGEGEGHDGGFAGFGEARRALVASADGGAPRVGLEPAGSALQHGTLDTTRGSGGENVAIARDAAAPPDAARASGSTQRAPLGDGTTLPSWIARLASPQRLAARRSTALRLDLEPAGLGRIEVRLSFGRDGVRAQVMTEHDHTRALLAQQQPQLAAAFERGDLRLESFLVDVGGFGDASGEAHREVEDPAAWDAAFANGAAREGEHEVPSATVVTGLLSVRA